ncbi:MAG: diacylglycerol kinase family protein [Novosphingobium sp.]
MSAEGGPDLAGAISGSPGPARSMPRIGVLRNPRSHRNKRCAPVPMPSPEVRLAEPRTRAELEPALRAFAAEGLDILIIDGGDGTIRDVLTCGASVFGTRWPILAVLPKGKTNALALDLGVPDDWTLDAALAVAKSAKGEVGRRPLVVERDGGTEVWGFIFGTGAFNAAIASGQTAHRLGAFQGFAIGVATALGIGQALFGLGSGPWRRTAAMRLKAQPGSVELPHSGKGSADLRYLALFSTLRTFPLRIRPFRASESDIRYLVFDAPLRRTMALVPAILAGADWPLFARLGVHRGSSTAFSLELEDRFVLDGEGFPADSIRLRQGPELRFIVP